VKVRTRFERIRPVVICPEDERMVDSSAKAESDINVIVSRYKKTGVLGDELRRSMAKYGDFSQVPSYAQMHEKLIAARDAFSQLPAAVRKQFDNDPGKFIAGASTPEGVELMKKFGLGKPEDPTPLVEPLAALEKPQKRSKAADATPPAIGGEE